MIMKQSNTRQPSQRVKVLDSGSALMGLEKCGTERNRVRLEVESWAEWAGACLIYW